MIHDSAEEGVREHFDISLRFRRTIEQRIARLEADALLDEAAAQRLDHKDHFRRHMNLVAAQRAEALRMKRFLENTRTRAV